MRPGHPNEVTRQEEAFDFSTDIPQSWEIDLIRQAVLEELLEVDSCHALREARNDSIRIDDVLRVILDGIPADKDLSKSDRRQIGINFEGKIPGGRRIRAKVGWFGGYTLVTVHPVRRIRRFK